MAETLQQVACAARACTLCADRLPLGPRPILRVSASARLLIIGQAPGTRVHASGVPWDDPSGVRLRGWMGVDAAEFYDESRIAILPMGLCYPGRLANGGDAAPLAICAPTWHPRLLALMPAIELTLLVGSYALGRALGKGAMAAHVGDFRQYLPARMPLPHPSWRTGHWERSNAWFGTELLPALRARVRAVLDKPAASAETRAALPAVIPGGVE